jgi:hypothetical protein
VSQSWPLAAVWCEAAIAVIIVAGPARLSRKHREAARGVASRSGVVTPEGVTPSLV